MFVFYDTETTGIDKNFTQILQIGLLFTDDDLNVLASKKADGRHSPWALPAPAALLTTGFMPGDLKASKNSNYEMMRETDSWLRGQHWPVTFVGYNSIGYDEPVLSQNFYQNLLDPGLTTGKNGVNGQANGRADVMNMVEMAALYMPGALKLDIKNYYGSPSLTLKNVARQNGVVLSDADAHDALNDIKATVGVAKVIKKAAPQIWEQALKLSTVAGVDDFLSRNEIFTSAEFEYGRAMRSSVMTSVAADGVEGTLFDLRADPAPYLKMSVAELKQAMLSQNNPFVSIQKNAQPALMPMELSEPVLKEDDKISVFKARAKALKADPAFLENVARAAAQIAHQKAHAQPADAPPEVQIDKKLGVAVTAKLTEWAIAFHTAPDWAARAKLTEGFAGRFKDELEKDPSLARFGKMAECLVYEHAPEQLSVAKRLAMKKFIAGRILNPDPKAPYMTIAKARKDLSTIEWQRRKPDNEKWKDVTDGDIRRLKLYYTALEKAYLPFSPYPQQQQQPASNNNEPPQKPSTGFNGSAPKP